MRWTTPPPEGTWAAEPAAPTPARAQEHHVHHAHLPAGAHVADRRGLTATGAVALAIVLGLVGVVIDLQTGKGLRSAFEVSFVLGTALAAALVHREDLRAAVVVAPFTYSALAVISGFFDDTTASGSVLKQSAVAMLDALVLHAPALFLATGLALAIALVRRSRTRRA